MKKFFAEFKSFISKGSVIDLAVGVIIGSAFASIVDSLVDDIISPVLGLFASEHLENQAWELGGVRIGYGAFLTSVINFLLMALVLFALIKLVNRLSEAGHKLLPREEAAPKSKKCPYCKSDIPADAVKCAWCTSDLTPEKTAE
ncbi:MAG: large conductance mechanosensitive channel protein MscL [Oscillospiraceae bacterium]|nr:large conductance mechanosensitive channel protein MscL [Oscillospiraceae bacterium]